MVILQARQHLNDAGDWIEAAKEAHQEAYLVDLELTLEYRRQWRDDIVINELKSYRDNLLMRADQYRANAKHDLCKNTMLLLVARFLRA